ncbi:unnamed protein product [Ranitomeya imitator]|uniref:Uncharacterized protein n=1 Tax=Ranitomeya imitator TaxID=111125 RepID=A0ABN9LSW9_9NEOB|nr:unnamed protein product [Ranitomeya imitator]
MCGAYLPQKIRMIRDLRVKGIGNIDIGIRGGKVSQWLAQLESQWIWTLNPLNESLSFAPFL